MNESTKALIKEASDGIDKIKAGIAYSKKHIEEVKEEINALPYNSFDKYRLQKEVDELEEAVENEEKILQSNINLLNVLKSILG